LSRAAVLFIIFYAPFFQKGGGDPIFCRSCRDKVYIELGIFTVLLLGIGLYVLIVL
jgi:hypothetical protein